MRVDTNTENFQRLKIKLEYKVDYSEIIAQLGGNRLTHNFFFSYRTVNKSQGSI